MGWWLFTPNGYYFGFLRLKVHFRFSLRVTEILEILTIFFKS